MKDLVKHILNKRGISTIEIGISSLIIIAALCGFIDMVNNSQKLDTATMVTSYVSRVIGQQGGIQTVPNEQFYGNYVTSGEMVDSIEAMLARVGITEADYTLRIDGHELTQQTNIPFKTSGESFRIDLDVTYRWDMISQVVPIDLEAQKRSTRFPKAIMITRDQVIKEDWLDWQIGGDSRFQDGEEFVFDNIDGIPPDTDIGGPDDPDTGNDSERDDYESDETGELDWDYEGEIDWWEDDGNRAPTE